jgi:hypothetical protein
MMILMALVTTFATTPVLRLLQGRRERTDVFSTRVAESERVRA